MRTMYLIRAVDKDTGKSLYYYNHRNQINW